MSYFIACLLAAFTAGLITGSLIELSTRQDSVLARIRKRPGD